MLPPRASACFSVALTPLQYDDGAACIVLLPEAASHILQETEPVETVVYYANAGKAAPKQRSPRSKAVLADGKASAHAHLNGHAKAGLHLGERAELAAGDEGKWLHTHANGDITGVLARLSPESEHTASQKGSPAPVMSASADGQAETDRRASMPGEEGLPRLRKNPSCDEQYGSLPLGRQRSSEKQPLGSTPPDRSTLDEHAGSSRGGILQPGLARANQHMRLHARGRQAKQEQKTARNEQHERSQHLKHRHRDRQRERSRDEPRQRSASPSACEAMRPHTDPDQQYLGTGGTHEANGADSGQRAEAAVTTPDQAAGAAQLHKLKAPMTGAPGLAEALAHETCLQADSPQSLHPSVDTASDTDGAGDVRDLLHSLVSAAERDVCASAHTGATPEASPALGLVNISSASPAQEAMPESPLLADAAELPELTSAQPALASPVGNHAAPPSLAGDDSASIEPTPAQEDAGHALSILMLPGYGTGLEWDPDSLDTIPEEPILLLDVPLGPRIFATGVSSLSLPQATC